MTNPMTDLSDEELARTAKYVDSYARCGARLLVDGPVTKVVDRALSELSRRREAEAWRSIDGRPPGDDTRLLTHNALNQWLHATDPVARHNAFFRMIDLGREYQRGGTGG